MEITQLLVAWAEYETLNLIATVVVTFCCSGIIVMKGIPIAWEISSWVVKTVVSLIVALVVASAVYAGVAEKKEEEEVEDEDTSLGAHIISLERARA